MPVGSEHNYDFTAASPKEKDKRERERGKRKSHAFSCTASKKNMHKGNICVQDIRNYNQSNTVGPNSCQEIQ